MEQGENFVEGGVCLREEEKRLVTGAGRLSLGAGGSGIGGCRWREKRGGRREAQN